MFVAKSGPIESRLFIEIGRPPFGSDKPGLIINTPFEIRGLVDDLESDNPTLSYNAACALASNKDPKIDPEIVGSLMSLVLNDKTTSIARCNAALILGYKGDVRTITPLALALKSDNPELYKYSASALSHLLSKEEADPLDVNYAINELKKGLSSDKEDIDKAAVIVLGELEKEEALEPLIDYLTGRDENMRSCARNLLVNFRNDKTTKLLVGILQDEKESPEAKSGAIWLLGEFDRELTNPYFVEDLLIKYLKDDKENKGIRLSSIEALGKMWSKKAVDPLIELLKLKDQAFSHFGIEALSRIRDPKAIPYIVKLLENTDPEFSISDIGDSHEVARDAACVLANMEPSDVAEPLCNSLLNEDPVIKLYAFEALNNIDLPKAINIDPVISCLNHKKPQVRKEAIKLLGKIGDPKAVDPLIKYLDDDAPEIRALTAEALGEIMQQPNKEAADCYTRNVVSNLTLSTITIGQSNAETIDEYKSSLIKNLTSKTITALVNILDTDHNQQVCSYAAFALSKIEDPYVAIHLVMSLLKNNDPEIRSLIVKLLMNKGKDIVPAFVGGLCSDDRWISSRSQEAIGQLDPLLLRLGLIECMNESYEDKVPDKVREKARLLLQELRVD